MKKPSKYKVAPWKIFLVVTTGIFFISTLYLTGKLFIDYIAEHFDENVFKLLFRTYLTLWLYYLVNAVPTFAFLYSLTLGDIPADHESQYLLTYTSRIVSGNLKETKSQTNSDMIVSLYKSNCGPKSISHIRATHHPDLPLRFVSSSRNTISAPNLGFNSFSYDSAGMILQFDRFEVTKPVKTFQDLGGVDKLREFMEKFVIHPFAQGKTSWRSCPKGVLLIGEPGCGKTVSLEAVVNDIMQKSDTQVNGSGSSCRVRFFKVECANCFASSIGNGATFQDVFHHATNNFPSVLVFENLEMLYDRSAMIFLSELGSIQPGKVLVFATTSKRGALHENLLRPGKFDLAFEIPELNLMDRKDILCICFQKLECEVEDGDINELALRTVKFNAAELEELATLIKQRTFREKEKLLSQQGPDFEKAVRKVDSFDIMRSLDKYKLKKRQVAQNAVRRQSVLSCTVVRD